MADVLTAGATLLNTGTAIYGAADETARNNHEQERRARVGGGLEQQNERLLAGPAGPPTEYGQQVQGYGYADENGQYAPIQSATPFAPGMPQAAAAQAGGNPVDTPEMRLAYEKYLSQFPQQGGGIVNAPGVPQPMTPMGAGQPNMFGIPVWFDDGGQRG
jgi:hypothetical protein